MIILVVGLFLLVLLVCSVCFVVDGVVHVVSYCREQAEWARGREEYERKAAQRLADAAKRVVPLD